MDNKIIVSTHRNTNYIHNHFIIYSVSFKTGKKYNNNRTNLAKLRYISDSICKEYNLSPLEEKEGYKGTYKNRVMNSKYYKALKEDLDNAISESLVMKQFYDRLNKLGYNYYNHYSVITI